MPSKFFFNISNFAPELWVNLFSIKKALKNGFKIGNEEIIIHLSKSSSILSFDRVQKLRMVGYPPNHSCDVYRMINLKTKHIIKLRGIV
jgi:hypothetical protein